jgi:hypothetical protein
MGFSRPLHQLMHTAFLLKQEWSVSTMKGLKLQTPHPLEMRYW